MRHRVLRWLLTLTVLGAIAVAATGVLAAPALERRPTFFVTPTWGALSSPLGWRHDPFQPGLWDYHWGIDIAAPIGTPVIASAPGFVRYAAAYRGYGGLVVIGHQGEWITVYGHLDRMTVRPGQFVIQGTVIGSVGRTGHSSGPHLHFEIRHRGIPVDPLRYLDR